MLTQDTRLKKQQDGRVPTRVPGCHTFYKSQDENCHGILTIVRKNVSAQVTQMQKTTLPGENTKIWTVKIWLQDDALLIHNIYIVKNTLMKLLNNPIPAFIGYDINAHHLLCDTKSDAAGRKIMDQLEQFYDYDTLNEDPTCHYHIRYCNRRNHYSLQICSTKQMRSYEHTCKRSLRHLHNATHTRFATWTASPLMDITESRLACSRAQSFNPVSRHWSGARRNWNATKTNWHTNTRSYWDIPKSSSNTKKNVLVPRSNRTNRQTDVQQVDKYKIQETKKWHD